jgi:LysM repeat protein
MMRKLLLLLVLVANAWAGFAQKSYNEQVLAYIARFKDLAIAEQQRTGVPASIKLAQGIYETAAGSSELCTNASNHFGIKCKNTWTGDTYTYTDDAKDECFRKYESDIASYKDHSDFLKNNKRYSTLFLISPTDYTAWAYGLKRCGYATNPQYAKKIIKTIEDFKLQEYTYAGISRQDAAPVFYADASGKQEMSRRTTAGENIPEHDRTPASTTATAAADEEEELIVTNAPPQERESGVKDYYVSTTKNGKRGFYARKGDILLEYAIKNRIRYAKILELNDLNDAPLEADMFVYLERKSKSGDQESHMVKDGETLLQISQQEGVQLSQIRLYNHLNKGEEPMPGTVLNLQSTAGDKPNVYASGNKATAAATYERATPVTSTDNAYIATNRKTTPSSAEMAEHEEETAAPLEKTVAARNNKKVNIADETPVEEEIATERVQQKKVDESKMTALEKLKAHMDKSVYAGRKENFTPQQSSTTEQTGNEDAEEIATVPARKAAKVKAAPVAEPERNRKKEKEVAAKGKDKKKEKEKPNAKGKNKPKSHTVRKGETAFGIAERYDISVSQLQKWNKLSAAKKIQPGMKLKIQP